MDELFEALTLVQTKKIFPIGIFLVGVDYWAPMLEFIKKSMLSEGTISEDDFNLIRMTDDLDMIVKFTEDQIKSKLSELEDEDLTDLEIYQRLKDVLEER